MSEKKGFKLPTVKVAVANLGTTCTPNPKHTPGISSLIEKIKKEWENRPNIGPAEEYKRYRWKMISDACGYEIKSDFAAAKALGGAPEHIANDDRITPYAWELCRQFQKVEGSAIDGLAYALHVSADQLRAVHRAAMAAAIAPEDDPCTCDAQDIQPLGECICGASKCNPTNDDGNTKDRPGKE